MVLIESAYKIMYKMIKNLIEVVLLHSLLYSQVFILRYSYLGIVLVRYRISSKDSAPLIFRHVVTEMCTKPPNVGRHFGSSSQ